MQFYQHFRNNTRAIYPKFHSHPCYYNTNTKNESMEINLNGPIKPWFTRIVFDQIDPVSGLILLILILVNGKPLIS